jgi:hypothetical protein
MTSSAMMTRYFELMGVFAQLNEQPEDSPGYPNHIVEVARVLEPLLQEEGYPADIQETLIQVSMALYMTAISQGKGKHLVASIQAALGLPSATAP